MGLYTVCLQIETLGLIMYRTPCIYYIWKYLDLAVVLTCFPFIQGLDNQGCTVHTSLSHACHGVSRFVLWANMPDSLNGAVNKTTNHSKLISKCMDLNLSGKAILAAMNRSEPILPVRFCARVPLFPRCARVSINQDPPAGLGW